MNKQQLASKICAYVNLKLGQCDGLKLGQLPVSHSLVSLSL